MRAYLRGEQLPFLMRMLSAEDAFASALSVSISNLSSSAMLQLYHTLRTHSDCFPHMLAGLKQVSARSLFPITLPTSLCLSGVAAAGVRSMPGQLRSCWSGEACCRVPSAHTCTQRTQSP